MSFNFDEIDVPDQEIIVDRNKEIWDKVKKRWGFILHLMKYRFKSYTIKKGILDFVTLFLTGCIILNIILNPHIIVVYVLLFITVKLNSY
ncbi:MAG: hypothetical protein IAE91_03370 [Ignavibacteriaceae bacterium]|nr:hypothetical protein [Ignavibacteriaceae bacterium]